MGPLFKLVGEMCDNGKRGSPLFVLCHRSNAPTYRDGADFFVITKT